MKLIRLLALLGLTVGVGAGCVPDPLKGLGDAGVSTNSTANNGTMGGDAGNNTMTGDTGGGGGNFTTDFIAVTEIMKQNCLLGGCHGDPPGAAQVFVVPQGTLATPGDIQAVISSSTPTPSGNRLITPNQPSMSEVYIRVTKPEGDAQLMGAGTYGATATPLMDTQIQTIEQFISNGAQYTQ